MTEAGVNRLILRSNKPEAADFQEWVTAEVLPAIRRNGGYMTPEVAQQAIDDPAALQLGCGLIQLCWLPSASTSRVGQRSPD